MVLTTGEIISGLNENEESPWADWDKGMTAKKLGAILKGFGVKSGRHRKDGDQKRGYALEELKPVFDRYLATPPPENGHGVSVRRARRGSLQSEKRSARFWRHDR